MRIVGGRLKGRNITTPTGRKTRPTSDQARESLFNILAHAEWAPPLEDAVVADIFAGSGALGLEAISRGAAFCLFIEEAPGARAAIRDNVDAMGLGGMTRVFRRDATRLKIPPSQLRGPLTHIFLDPPYDKKLWQPAIRALLRQDLLAPDALFILETGAEEEIVFPALTIEDERIWGAAKVTFARARHTDQSNNDVDR